MEEILILLQKDMDKEQTKMSNGYRYKVVALCGPAGSGKDYLAQKVKEQLGDDVNLVVADTTRPPRLNEINGQDYNFFTPDDFFKREHLEITSFNNWYYGTPMNGLRRDKVNLLILNPVAVLQVYRFASNIDLEIIRITAPDKTRMLRQLNRVESPDVYEICRRFLADQGDFLKLQYLPCKLLTNHDERDGQVTISCIIDVINSLKSDLDNMG